MSNLNALFSTSSKTSGSRASANRSSVSTPRLTSQSSGSFDSDDSIAPLSSVSTLRARNDDGIILIIFVFI